MHGSQARHTPKGWALAPKRGCLRNRKSSSGKMVHTASAPSHASRAPRARACSGSRPSARMAHDRAASYALPAHACMHALKIAHERRLSSCGKRGHRFPHGNKNTSAYTQGSREDEGESKYARMEGGVCKTASATHQVVVVLLGAQHPSW